MIDVCALLTDGGQQDSERLSHWSKVTQSERAEDLSPAPVAEPPAVESGNRECLRKIRLPSNDRPLRSDLTGRPKPCERET